MILSIMQEHDELLDQTIPEGHLALYLRPTVWSFHHLQYYLIQECVSINENRSGLLLEHRIVL